MKTLSFVVGAVLSLLSARVVAQQAAPVYVDFRFKSRSVSSSYKTTEIAALENRITQRLASACQTKVLWWTFTAADQDPNTAKDQFPRIEVLLKESSNWDLIIRVLADVDIVSKDWRLLRFKPTDYEDNATDINSRWEEYLVPFFSEEFLESSSPELNEVLIKHAPLGRSVILPPNVQTPVVLPLQWARYKRLSASRFIIRCRMQGGGVVDLYSEGLEDFASIPQPPPPFDGILVQLNGWVEPNKAQEEIGNRISGLQPLAFYLLERRPTLTAR